MPIYEYECPDCGTIFEVILDVKGPAPSCPDCGKSRCRRLMAAPAIHVKTDQATPRIERRVKDYLKDGKISDAVRFADRAASMTKSDRVKRIADKLHQKTAR